MKISLSAGGYNYPYILVALVLVLAACGGGSSGGGSHSGGIHLVSITFPIEMGYPGIYGAPPESAPLSQQIVFTFSGLVKGPLTSSSILITSDPGLDYSGPHVLYNPEKHLIEAKGTFDIFSNIIIFTPNLPKKKMNLGSPHASLDELPGLLPETTYEIFVPIGTYGSIGNLAGIGAGVKNPESFTTGPNLFFKNLPLAPPQVIETKPEDGCMDFPVNSLEVMAGFKKMEEIKLVFDQPLNPEKFNLEGEDGNGDGIIEPNVFLLFSEKLLFASCHSLKGIFRLDRENPGWDPMATFKPTRFEGVDVALSDLTFDRKGRLTGLSGGVLYGLDIRCEDPVVELTLLIDTSLPELTGLACSLDGRFFSVDRATGRLMRIDADAGVQEELCLIEKGSTVRDLAYRCSGDLYMLRVEGGLSYLEVLDPEDGSIQSAANILVGSFDAMDFSASGMLCLFEEKYKSLWSLDLITDTPVEIGTVAHPWSEGLDWASMFYELETEPIILENLTDQCVLSACPAGMLPFGSRVEMMVRNRLENIRGWSLSDEEGEKSPALASRSIASFTTEDPGFDMLFDEFLEDFNDNIFESPIYPLGETPAVWNYQDQDITPPNYDNLLATFGHGGSGSLGVFEPTILSTAITLDTDYQPLPLLDGSTPDVIEPVVLKDGIFDFRRIHIPKGITIYGHGSNPLVFRVTEDVIIEGTIDVSGMNGSDETTNDSGFFANPGGLGGPCGGRGGEGHPTMPPAFQSLTQLFTPPKGANGWDPWNTKPVGGRGGQTGAFYDFVQGKGVNFAGPYAHEKSRGAGGGGGSMLWEGGPGRDGKCNYVPDCSKNKIPKNKTDGGQGGDPVFQDGNPHNNYFGISGEFSTLHGGQGGGGGGSRWDSLNPACQNATLPGYPNCMWDARGGGAGGGGGALAIHALGEIRITSTGSVLARGGRGGGGETLASSNGSGAGGGGGGGAVLLHSGERIVLEEEPSPYPNPDYKDPMLCGAVIDVSGGMMGDAQETASTVIYQNTDPCPMYKTPWKEFCTLSVGDGGQGGFGIIQLMVEDPDLNIEPPPIAIADAKVFVGARIFATDPLEFHPKNKNNPYYMRNYLTYESDPIAYPKVFQWGKDPHNPEHKIHVHEPPLTDPHKTPAFLTSVSFAISRWIDFAGINSRYSPGGPKLPIVSSFLGTDPLTGIVITENGYVKNYHMNGYNDIEVDAPDLFLNNYIPEDNEVKVEFQGAHPAAPGLHVPGEEMSDWTADLASLSGYTLIRFRVSLNTAKSGKLHTGCTKPQVNRVRIRVSY